MKEDYLYSLQDSHDEYLSNHLEFPIPTEEDFIRFDVDPKDGVITFDEVSSNLMQMTTTSPLIQQV